jgi:hypothetical protein
MANTKINTWQDDVLVAFSPPNEVFWCARCDCELVDSKKPATGKFFRVNGHVYDFNKKKSKPAWPCVVFAICSSCLRS